MEALIAMYRKICFIGLTALVIFAILPGLAVSAYQGVPDAVVAIDQLAMRSGPARTADIIAVLVRGTRLTLDGRNRDSTWVHGTAETGAVGWVSKPYLSIRTTLVIAALPIMDANAATAGGGQSGGGGNSGAQKPTPTRVPPAAGGRTSGR